MAQGNCAVVNMEMHFKKHKRECAQAMNEAFHRQRLTYSDGQNTNLALFLARNVKN